MKVRKSEGPATRIKFKTKVDAPSAVMQQWWLEKEKDKAAAFMIGSAAFLKENQTTRISDAALYARLYGNMSLFNFSGLNVRQITNQNSLPQQRPTFNLVQSCVDTLLSRISQSRPQPVFLTDDSDYKQRTLGKKLNRFIQGEFYHTEAYEKGTLALRDALVQGDGILHVYEDDDNRAALERVFPTELLVDAAESIYDKPRQMYRAKLVDREVLANLYPSYRKKIELAATGDADTYPQEGRTVSDMVMVVEGWHLRSSKKSNDGRHTIAISTGAILDEKYEKDYFPFVFLKYSPRLYGFWAQGVAEQLMGTQRELNQILFTISRAIKLVGVPRIYVEDGSGIVKAHLDNQIGTIVTYRGTPPVFNVSESNAPDLYEERDRLIKYGYEQVGVSSMQAAAQKPAGLDSGEAIRSYDDISTDRFAALARRYDNFYIELAHQVVDLAKDIAERDGHYSTVYPNKNGIKEVDLPAADLIDDSYVIQCYTQSSLPKEPAGRLQKVIEMMQAGLTTPQEGRRLLDYPDLTQTERLANAAEERILKILDDIIEEGKYTPPDPFMDLQLATELTVQYINLYEQARLEEEKAEMLRDFFTQIQTLIQAATPPPMPQPGTPGQPTQSGQPQPQPQAQPEAPPTNPMIPNVP